MKEKSIERSIIQFLAYQGAVVEGMQSGAIMVAKGKYNHKMKLQSAGCPDITCFYKGEYIGIEVKKDEKEVQEWLKKEERFMKDKFLPISYKREEDQIRYKQKILKNGGTFILTHDIKEVIEYISLIDKKSKINLQ